VTPQIQTQPISVVEDAVSVLGSTLRFNYKEVSNGIHKNSSFSRKEDAMNQRWLGRRLSEGSFLGASAVFILITSMFLGLAQAGEAKESEGWKIHIVPYLWMPSLNGTVGVRGQTADVDMSFSDILDDLSLAFMTNIEVSKGRFGMFANPLYTQLKDDTSTEILSQKIKVEATMNMFILEFGVNYRFGPYALDGSGGKKMPRVTLRPLIGGRYTYLDSDIDTKGLQSRSFDGSQDWIDPVIGVHTQWDFTKRWNLILGGSIGGFGVGSDFAWSAIGLVGYRFNFSKTVTGNVLIGYRALDQNYDTGSGSDRFEWDTTMYGPIVGLSIGF